MPATHALSDVDPFALTLVKRGANRQTIFLRKEHGEPTVSLPAPNAIIKDGDGDEWTTFYCVVAEPGAEEDGGLGAPGVVDVWKDEDEIRRAAHRFLKNKGYVNAMHGALAEAGCHVVENAVALTDLDVNGTTIKKGSWYIAIEPTTEFRARIDSGEVTGVSMEGSGLREQLVEKASYEGAKKCPSCSGKVATDSKSCQNCGHSFSVAKGPALAHEPTIGSHGGGLFGMKGKQLPAYIQHVYNDLVEGGQKTGSHTYRLAVGIVQNWAEGHDGHGNKVSAETQAKAVAAIAEWNKLRAQARADNVNKETTMDDDTKRGLLKSFAAALGLTKTADLTDDEKQLIASLSKGGTVTGDTPQEDDMKPEEVKTLVKEQIEESQKPILEAVTALTDKIEKAVKPPEDEKLTIEKVSDTLEAFVEKTAEGISKLDAAITKLGEGGSDQPDDRKTDVQKSDNPLAGLLD